MRFRFGQVLTRTEATLSGFRLVRNLSEPHVHAGRLPNALISIESWFAVAASALPSGNALARAQKCGIEMPTGHFNVRNLLSPHAHASRSLKIAYGVCLDGRVAPVDSALAEQHLMRCSSRAELDRAGDACPSKQTVGERQLIR